MLPFIGQLQKTHIILEQCPIVTHDCEQEYSQVSESQGTLGYGYKGQIILMIQK